MTSKEIVKAFIAAHNKHDIDRMMTFLTDDCVTIDVAAPIPLQGKEDVRKLYEMIFSSIDIHFEITTVISEDNKVFAAWRTTGPGIGVWAGRDVRGLHCDVFEGCLAETRGEKISKMLFYSDTATLSRQMGGYSPAIKMGSEQKTLL
jgi:predicted ester cyclase